MSKYWSPKQLATFTLDSGIDVGQEIHGGTGKIWQKFEVFVMKKSEKNSDVWLNVGLFNKAVGPGKKSKINKCRAYVYFGL